MKPDLIFYTCIATGTTILAEFNSRDADLATLALKCLAKTPNHHISFTHTVHNRSYTFLIECPFVYFAIYDSKLEYPEAITYLKSVRDAFDIIYSNSEKYEHNFASHCFQGEFNPILHQLLAENVDYETPFSARDREICEIGKSGDFENSPMSSLKKKKKRVGNGDSREGFLENKVDFLDGDFSVNRSENSFSGGSFKAKRVWKRHVWVILTLDLVLCLVLIGVWLWVCRGFKCIDG